MGSFIATARNRHLGSVHLFYDGDVVPHDADMQAENGPQGVVLRVLENDAAQSREGVIMTYTYESAEGPTKSRHPGSDASDPPVPRILPVDEGGERKTHTIGISG